MEYIVLNLAICAAYILFAGILRSKYYQDIRHKGIEMSSDILCAFVIVLSVAYMLFAQEGKPLVQMCIFASMCVGELIVLGYAFYIMHHLSFEYERQKVYAWCALFFTLAFALIQAGYFLIS